MAGYIVMILEWFWIDAKLKCIKNALAGWARDQAARHFGGGERHILSEHPALFPALWIAYASTHGNTAGPQVFSRSGTESFGNLRRTRPIKLRR